MIAGPACDGKSVHPSSVSEAQMDRRRTADKPVIARARNGPADRCQRIDGPA